MHSGFRTLGQQMGMQLVRGILPESIDIYLNDVIVEKTQNELLRGVNTALQDNVNLQTSSMNPTNLFRTLYRNARFEVGNADGEDVASTKLIKFYNKDNGYYEIHIPTIAFDGNTDEITLSKGEYYINPMMYLSFSLEFDDKSRGRSTACRMLGADTIETTLRDYCNGADKSNPIVTLISAPIIDEDSREQTSGVSQEYIEVYTNTPGCEIKYLNIKYIKAPNVVKFDLDPTKCVNCDLPEYCHFEIVERAVQKYYMSIGQGRIVNEQQKG